MSAAVSERSSLSDEQEDGKGGGSRTGNFVHSTTSRKATMPLEDTFVLKQRAGIAIKDGSESGVLLTEFAELTAAAWRHVAGEGSCEAVLQRSASTCNAVRACRQRTAQIG